MDLEVQNPELFKRIAAEGRRFATTYLTRDAVYEYTAALLTFYAASLSASPPALQKIPSPAAVDVLEHLAAKVVAHVSGVGDVDPGADGWTGRRGGGLTVEGFALSPPADLGPQISYQVLGEDGALSEPVRAGEYCGTKGNLSPIFGFLVRADGGAAKGAEIAYEGEFLDGTRLGPIPAPQPCRSPTNAPLQALRMIFGRPRRPPDVDPRPVTC